MDRPSIIGIDLGTTNSLVGVFQDGAPRLIPNSLGELLTPSSVSIDDQGSILVGMAARERASSQPTSTAQAFKRWMGTDHSLVLQDPQGGSRSFRAEELSALVLQSLKADAEAFLGHAVEEAVITVPAYFNEAQRRATRLAGELAGLKVERLLNEPTAAGLAYGIQSRPGHCSFLVFDLGGGTFDVSVLEYFDGVVEVRASAGDTRLGGEDFAHALGLLFAENCGLSPVEREDWLRERAWWRLAEQGKRELGEIEMTKLAMVWRERCLEAEITREAFEANCQLLLQRLRRPIERALNDARIETGGLSEIVLVGGATRMPMVRQLVTRLFHRLPLRTIDPDLAIAHGAAVQAGLKARDEALSEIVLTDVMPYSLGVVSVEQIEGRLVKDRFSPIIERNMPVPISRVEHFRTIADMQSEILLDVRQGESPVGSENLRLGTLEVRIPPAPAGARGIEVRFTYDVNGLLEVDAREPGMDKVFNLLIEAGGGRLTPPEIAAARERLQALKRHPRDEAENRYLIERAKRIYEDRTGEERRAVQAWLGAFEVALESQDSREIRRARQQLREALDSVDRGFRF
ncbi:MAG TPA: molecular chaperone HscC [Burkholderiaceae bacterium]